MHVGRSKCGQEAKLVQWALGALDGIEGQVDTCGETRNVLAGCGDDVVLVAGVEEHVTPSFCQAEPAARIQAVFWLDRGLSQPMPRLGSLTLNHSSRAVTVDGEDVHLTNKEFAVMELLLLRRGTALSKGEFLNHLYGGMNEPDVKIVDVFICKLRKKLADAGAANLIRTVWSRGYMLAQSKLGAPHKPPRPSSVRDCAEATA